ncbi:FAD/NAD(P)-binding protein [Dickeya zeae]|uniref:FAD/NAD(P)-binding protein n=1 Tax=Dickeya zeae TaxID=204042 RepID=UPI0014401EE8|nr:FAD/NAD(P)-binding protein [Dickeya zeae]QIZ45432.1 hypothetical protein DWV07_00240 [Dickeya zeae]
MFDLAIIGVGATGVSLLKQLQDEVYAAGLASPKIALFCPKEDFACGKAFGDAAAIHKVNTPPNMLCISRHEPDGFSRWMSEKGEELDLYPNRLMYAKFLHETYQGILNLGILKIEEFYIHVDSLHPYMGGYKINTGDGVVTAKKIVMCLGALHGSTFPTLAAQTGFVDHHRQFMDIPDGPVLVAGSGLTAVDAARSLAMNRNREIHLFSRHGYAPTCLTAKNTYTPKALNWKNLLDNKGNRVRLSRFIHLLNQERQYLLGKDEVEPALHRLRSEGASAYFEFLMQKSAAADLPYQDILVSTRPYMHKLWQMLPVEDRVLFSNHYGSEWAVWRHPIPYEVMSELAQAAKEKRLHIHKASRPPLFNNGSFSIETADRKSITSPFMVDGTGGSNQLSTIDSALLKNLLQQGLIESHPCGGMNIHPMTFECRVNGTRVPNLYNIGPLNKGCLFSTNAFWFNAYCAGQWAKQYVIEMSHQHLSVV